MSYVLVKNNDWTEVEIKSNHFQVPDAWAAKQLSNVLIVESIRIENKVKKQDVRNKGKYIAISQEIEFSCGYSEGSPLVATAQKPHILFGDHNCSLKFVVEPYVLAGDGVKVLTSVNNAKFLFYALKNLGLQPIGYQRHFIQLKENVALIPPIEEQTAIANILSDQEALIAQYDNLIALHEKRFAYLSDELLSGRVRLVQKEVGEVELVRNNDWQRVALNGEKCQFPAGWFVQSIGKITKTVTGNTPATSNKTYWNEKTGTPWFSTPDLRQHVNGYISEASRYLTEQGVQVARVYPAKTLLVSCIATIGEVGLLPRSGSFNQQINGVLPNDEIDTNYLRFWFIYKKSDFQRFAPTSVVPIINKSLFNKFEVLYPPLEEQTLIAQVLSDQEALIAQYKKLRDAEKKRFDWLSDALLSGTYRVKVEA